MKETLQLISSLDNILKEKNLRNYEKLLPPLQDREVNELLTELNVKDDDFRTLYQWKNGFDPDGKVIGACQIFKLDIMLPLNWVLKKVLINKTDPIWDDSFIPFITDSTGQFFLFNNSPGNNYGKIHLYSVSLFFIEEPISYYDSIGSMIETTIEAYSTGALKYDPDEDWLDEDIEKFYKIAKTINKNSDRWTKVK
jgi:hypothetical protein